MIDLITILFNIQDTLEGLGMTADLAIFAAIMIFVGGLVFWVLMAVAGLNALYRGVTRLFSVGRRRMRAAK